ncbi:MAG: ATP-binding protein [Maribacter arcticus]|uniref:sensor histidine kinase n=1 Tax=Maribacter arcticus TaxID=561365 RepID=UPI0030026C4F
MKSEAQLKAEIERLQRLVEKQALEVDSKNRELEIEAALERVRERAMSMQKSEELRELVFEFYKQIHPFGFAKWGFEIKIAQEDKSGFYCWISPPGARIQPEGFEIPTLDHWVLKKYWSTFELQTPSVTIEVSGDDKRKLGVLLLGQSDMKNLPEDVKTNIMETEYVHFSVAAMRFGLLKAVDMEPVLEKDSFILQRFAKVFEQTYTRFLDLQKAEAQAREAQIEVALERVRARAMAMHKSEELGEAAELLYEELRKLGLSNFINRGYVEIDEENNCQYGWMTNSKGKSMEKFNLPLDGEPTLQMRFDAWLRKESVFCQTVGGDELKKHLAFVNPQLGSKEVLEHVKNFFHDPTIFYSGNFSHGYLSYITKSRLSADEEALLARFTQVFEMTYKRFLDLQKAEAQAREAQIEAALERIRARAMAMHQTNELFDVLSVLFDQFDILGINPVWAHLSLIDFEENTFTYRMTGPKGRRHMAEQVVSLDARQEWQNAIEIFKKADSKSVSLLHFPKEVLPQIWDLFSETLNSFPKGKGFDYNDFPNGLYNTQGHCKFGYIGFNHNRPPSEEEKDIVVRFATEFARLYQRFLDIEKAEAQAKEAQIQLSLERVRARSMAMQSSDELHDVLSMLFQQFDVLDINPVNVFLSLFDRQKRTLTYRASGKSGMRINRQQTVSMDSLEVWSQLFDKWKNDNSDAVEVIFYDKEILPTIFDLLSETFASMPKEERMTADDFPDGGYTMHGYTPFGYIGYNHTREATEEEKNILTRFATEFSRVYQRFLDIQKAEAQAREAQIEASLERVRSKTMAMHNSQDVGESVATLFDELFVLGLLGVNDRCGIGIMQPNEIMEAWTAAKTPEGKAELTIGFINMKVHPMMVSAYGGWIEKKEINQYILEGEDKLSYYDAIRNQSDYKIKRDYFSDQIRIVHTDFYFNEGCLYVFSENEFSAEATSVFLRFVGVFGQTYRRYLDLQRAEKQAKEAQIEAALERVRSRSMAMQHSSELNLILSKVFEELTNLELQMERAVIWIYYPENRSVRWWAANPEAESGSESFFIANQDDPVYDEYWKAWEERRTKDLYVLEGDYKENWTEILFNKTECGRLPEVVKAAMVKPDRVYLYNTFNDFGVLFISCLEPLSDDKFTILERFGKVFDQSYTRFKDIKQAEAREKEAIKQSSLDRVRAEIASMRNTEDLQRITPLIWSELLTLGVPFFRCGLMIVDEKEEKVRFYLSTPDGKPLAALNLDFESNDISSNGVKHWRKQQPYIAHWNQEEFLAFTKTLIEQQQIENPSTYQGGETPPESLTLQFIPFPQGMLYVGSAEDLTPAQIDLVKNLADTFSVAYARYEDFKQLEDAKSQIEHTLSELKSTQSQLIQSEKMASLGELTAGIAHEIQNPLNFVNNFSEVSKELLEEMMEEIANGDMEEVKAIADDIIQNLEKINHHGQRADGIVKGMLQHSRSSSGTKEPTNINALADEYLRLAYHGLRAKDKSFNASLETDFDDAIGNINVVPQDLGRVILNLITNAFYAVNEKKQKDNNFKPIVSVSTKKTGDHLEIKVTDNGGGIPQKVLDKIFQPFFTTKPAGQGTGLGLSMSYDIVTKGHGGVLKVETKEGEGTTFCINLPVNNLP